MVRGETEPTRKAKADSAATREAAQRSEQPKYYPSNRAFLKPLDYQKIIYETNHETHVAKITLNRPEVMNALSHELRGELMHAMKVAENDNDINVIILKGAGRCFSAGYDIGGGMGLEEPHAGSMYVGDSHWARYLVNFYWQIWELSKIVIAQAHGYVLAGGSELCFSCDLLVTTPDCRFGYPPIRAMGAPDVMWFPWLLPMRKARELVFTGDNITGEQAFHYGMANYCVPEADIDEFTEIFAKRVALIPWQVNTLHKRGIQKAYELMGIRNALETHALQWGLLGHQDRIKEMGELIRKVPLREYLTIRDKPYADYRTAEEAILSRTKREGNAWKLVSDKAAKAKVDESIGKIEKLKTENK
ncbi:MAG: enoyl-CoA hydratase-related protein [Chloroflexota bacterium]